MADYVQQRLEDRIPGLEQLERVGLFTRKERIGYQFKREDIEFPIISRVTSVFRRATTKWQEDVQLWLSHVAFSKKWGTKAQLSKVFSSMLAIHPDKPSLWIMAAKCEMEDLDSSESARHLFLRALRFHPENKKVYQEYFRMELMHAEKLRKQQHELELAKIDLGEYEFSPEILSGKLAEVVYRDAKQKIKGAEFMLSLLNIAAIFDFTKELQDTILQDLQKEHTDDSVTWDFMARRELEAAGAPELRSAQGRASDTNRREERCCAVYEEGLRSLNTDDLVFVLLQKALSSPVPAISAALKETYLEWAYKTSGYKKARKIFKSLHEHRPFTKAFFTKMIQIEKEQVSFKTVFNLRDYYERALREFGSSDDDLWMGYIREELGAHGSPENCGKLHWRAIKSLVGESVERFTTQYTLMQTGHI
uniref:U3 small nucleolar RNA-associated protein 6 homolog C-terminal domain-containing protein n=1 Tax=Pygocentrus nattereri TaxID=42514 RepID=A0AAR2K2R3_PYGNA